MVSDLEYELTFQDCKIFKLREPPKALTTCLCERQINISIWEMAIVKMLMIIYINVNKWPIRSQSSVNSELGSETKGKSGIVITIS
ncbi:hypothetical protein F-M6_0227 [Faustovirus]|nr:hypothetical protein F-M6_0227 [Faustovirus]